MLEKSSSPSASSTSRFWSASVSDLRVTFSVAMIVRSATSRRMSSSARLVAASISRSAFLRRLGYQLLPAHLALGLVRLGRVARALHDLLGLRARLLQPLAVFGEDLIRLLAGVLGRVDVALDLLHARVESLAYQRENPLAQDVQRDREHHDRPDHQPYVGADQERSAGDGEVGGEVHRGLQEEGDEPADETVEETCLGEREA